MAYKKCPRCELNYIQSDIDMCDVCKAELKLIPDFSFDDDDYMSESKICPICKKILIEIDEDMCSFCRDKVDDPYSTDTLDDDEQWRAYLDDEKPVDIDSDELKILSLSELEEEEETAEEEFEDEEEFLDDDYEIPFDDDYEDIDEDFDDDIDEDIED